MVVRHSCDSVSLKVMVAIMNGAANRKVESQTMEDILTSIRRIIADDQKTPLSAPEVKLPPVVLQPSAPKLPEPSIEDDILALRTALNAIRGEVDDIRTDATSFPELYSEPEAEAEDVTELPETLVSPQAGQAVRQSFDALAQANKDSQLQVDVEAAAREMLRPMLQEWLDANLPSLVERLVQQEIARITGEQK